MKLDQQQLRNYVLGALTEAEQTSVEQALLADEEQLAEARELENDLVDGYVGHTLTVDERAQFERFYLASPLHRERVAIAKQFLQAIEQAPAPLSETQQAGWRAWWNSWRVPPLVWGGAWATALLLLAGGAFWWFNERAALRQQLAQFQQQAQSTAQAAQTLSAQKQALENELGQARERNAQLDAELERLRQTPAERTPIFTFLLAAGAARGNNTTTPTVPLLTSKIQLLMPLNGDRRGEYQATLQTVEGRALLTSSVRPTIDRAFAALVLPAGTLRRGDYVIVLSGRTTSSTMEEIDRYFFRVQ